MRHKISSIVTFLFLLVILPITLYLVKNIQRYLSKASFVPASIIVDVNQPIGPAQSPWKALAQGGETEEDRISPVFFNDVIPQLTAISPRYIRIDHLYDFYQVVSRNSDGSLSYNWSKLDQMVNDILKTGALPFLSLSYMPQAIAQGGNIVGLPNSWSDWENVVYQTIRHYSGRDQRNLNNVYYEVWNEPDLFGNWRIGGVKDYFLLYKFAAQGAQRLENVNNFRIGGPATTSPMKVWTDDFLTLVENNNLRIDFLSWHRYSFDPSVFSRDIYNVNSWLSSHPRYQNLPKIISEWGSDSENNPVHDSFFDAIHTLAIVRQFINQVDLAFSFEIKDSPGPENKKYWGRWGLFTHQKFGTTAKPRYFSLVFLDNLKGEFLSTNGEGSDITALSVKDNNLYKVLVVNYKNSRGGQQEAVPIKIINLPKGIYSYKETYLLGRKSNTTINVSINVLEKTLPLPANQAVLLELTKISDLATFEPGRFGYQSDQSLVLDKDNKAVVYQINQTLPSGTVEFWLKNNFEGVAISDQVFLDIPLGNNLNLIGRKDLFGFGSLLKFGLTKEGKMLDFLSQNITQWRINEWHNLVFAWDSLPNGNLNLGLTLDGKAVKKIIPGQKIDVISQIIVGGYNGNLEDLRISNLFRESSTDYLEPLITDKNTLILKHFDGSL